MVQIASARESNSKAMVYKDVDTIELSITERIMPTHRLPDENQYVMLT